MTTVISDPKIRQPIFVGRQPILDSAFRLFGYELLFRRQVGLHAGVTNDFQATAQVIVNAFCELSMGNLLGSYKGFVNVNEAFLFEEVISLLPAQQVVLEVLEHVTPSPALAKRCAELKKAGFLIAVDDLEHYDPAWDPILELADIIKIPLVPGKESTLLPLLDQLRRFGARFLAERVETREQAEMCRALGFSYFQGYFFAKPSVLSGQGLSPARLTIMQLLALLNDDNSSTHDIELTIKTDPSLTVNLLRLTNSAHYGYGTRIHSILQAVTLLGRKQIARWLQLLLYVEDNGNTTPTPLFRTAAARARLMELLAQETRPDLADEAFLCGVLSLAPVLLGMPIEALLRQIPGLSTHISYALLSRRGCLVSYLNVAEAVENENEHRLGCSFDIIEAEGFCPEWVSLAQIDALTWANALKIGE